MNDVRTVLLSAAIVEELELIWVCCRWGVDLFLFSCGFWRKHGVYAPEDGWQWRPKHVDQLSDKINSVACVSSWNYILEYYYDARTNEH
jgi:hypothetical protein